MLKSFLQHQLDRALRGEITNAITNCHAVGLDSIVFHDEPGNRVRMFLAQHHHTLHRNNPQAGNAYDFSLAIHAHHCDVRFVGIFGKATNDRYRIMPNPEARFQEMAYTSGVTGTGSLTPTGVRVSPYLVDRHALTTNPVMRASELHSIFVPRHETAAWLVIEGQEDPHYKSVCYTNDPNPDLSDLYQPMSQIDIVDALDRCIHAT